MTTVRRIEWLGVDDPSRRDSALVRIETDALVAAGASVADTWTSAWSLETAAGWATRRLVVRTQGPGWARSLVLERADDGSWSAGAAEEGAPDLPPPGLDDPHVLDGAVDCDLGLNPVTNSMPVRRLGLLDAAVPETVLLMAWVDMPSLAVHASRQRYASDAPALRVGAEADYSSEDRSFTARLTLEPDGTVLDYPGLARRLAPLAG